MENKNGKPRPRAIVVDLEKRLIEITWTDDHASLYAFRYLRVACPCAQCKPWIHGGPVGETPKEVLQATDEIRSLEDVRAVGSYALTIRWADGHEYGIYNWEYLRALCPCPEHAGRPEDRPPERP